MKQQENLISTHSLKELNEKGASLVYCLFMVNKILNQQNDALKQLWMDEAEINWKYGVNKLSDN